MNMGQVVSSNVICPCPWLSQNVKGEEDSTMENLWVSNLWTPISQMAKLRLRGRVTWRQNE